jgi:hypothetical protein
MARRFLRQYILGEHLLQLLQEPEEGIEDPSDSTKRILGIGNFQIDGQDDYIQNELFRPFYLPLLATIPPTLTLKNLFEKIYYPDLKDIITPFSIERDQGIYST